MVIAYIGLGLPISLVMWALIGAAVGLVFALIMGTGEHGGFWEYLWLGIVGSIISGILFRVLGGYPYGSWQVKIITGIFGAVVLMVFAQHAHQHARVSHHRARRHRNGKLR